MTPSFKHLLKILEKLSSCHDFVQCLHRISYLILLSIISHHKICLAPSPNPSIKQVFDFLHHRPSLHFHLISKTGFSISSSLFPSLLQLAPMNFPPLTDGMNEHNLQKTWHSVGYPTYDAISG